MIITRQNQEELQNNICVHDSYFTNIQHIYKSHQLTMEMKNYYFKKSYIIIFKDLYFLQMQCFDFWYESDNRILGWDLKNNEDQIDNIYKNEQKRAGATKLNTKKIENLVYTVHSQFVLNSGDTIEIICKEIEFTEQPLLDE